MNKLFIFLSLAVPVLIVFMVFAGLSVHAQVIGSAATISGKVLDPDGNVIAGATVIVKNDLTGLSRTVPTSADGRFAVPGLPVGNYTIEVSSPGFSTARSSGQPLAANGLENMSITLKIEAVNTEISVSEFVPLAATLAPSQSSLDAHSAESVISPEFIENFISPNADYTEVVQMAPGTFSFSPNGAGLGDTKTFFRGFKDGQYTITFDGIPFEDTNSPTHHSWAFFPGQFIGQTLFDRSPGSASTIGPTNFGGSINMMSHELRGEQIVRITGSYGSFNTRLYDAAYDSGRFGPGGKSSLMLDVHQMKSDGYQTYNYQRRNAFSLKYQYALSPRAIVTAFTSVVELKSNTPNAKGPTRAQVAQYGDNYLLSNDPNRPDYYKYNFYHIPSDFDYVGITSDLGHGWTFDTKVYTYRYYNKQNYNGTTISATSGVDKLNSYRKYGALAPLSQTSQYGVFRAGLWSEYAMTNRFQTPTDPRTWVDVAVPNFHEKFNTTTLQPYVEYEFKVARALTVTPGIKFAEYKFDFTQFADSKTVGNLNGQPYVKHSATYNSWQPALDANYKLRQNWSAYAQFATGSVIPPSNIFDVKDAAVAVLPQPTKTKTFQAGTVLKTTRATLDVDTYYIHFDNDYSSSPDPVTLEPVYFLTGTSRTKGLEAESNIYVAKGLSAYLNGTVGSAKYAATGRWVQNAPNNTETVGISYQNQNYDLGFFSKRIGQMFNDNGGTNEAVKIDPFNITNLYLNYTIKNKKSEFEETKIRLTINNLFDRHSLVAVIPASTTTSAPAPGDILTLLAARSVSLSLTFGFSPKAKEHK